MWKKIMTGFDSSDAMIILPYKLLLISGDALKIMSNLNIQYWALYVSLCFKLLWVIEL